MGEPTPDAASRGFFDSLRGTVLASIPALSALVFVIVAVKVFRASGMEATTTVAIVSEADQFTLLKGVVLTLLPGFLAALTAIAMWWWADSIPEPPGAGATTRKAAMSAAEAARRSLFSSQAAFAWSMVVMAYFTVSWPIFFALFLPVVLATVALLRERRAHRFRPTVVTRVRRALKWVGGTAAALAVGFLTLAPSVWLPLRVITVAPGHEVTANGHQMPTRFAAYILSSDDKGSSLLLAKPRAVIQVGADDIEGAQPLCVTPEASTRFLYLRLSQVLGPDSDEHSPYQLCPELDSQNIFGK